ncbi:MAG: T9SS type A sorting domain-containing protein [bacterium]
MLRVFQIGLIAALLTANSFGGTYTIGYQQQIDGAEGYVHIDPVVGESGELQGFVFCNNGHEILLMSSPTAQPTVLDVPRNSLATIHSGNLGVSLFSIFILSGAGSSLHLGAYYLDANDSTYVDCLRYLPMYPGAVLEHYALHFAERDNPEAGLLMSGMSSWWRIHLSPPYCGQDTGVVSGSQHISLDLSRRLIVTANSAAKVANLFSDSSAVYVGIEEDMRYEDWWQSPWGPYTGSADWSTFSVFENQLEKVFSSSTWAGDSYAIFADDFSTDYDFDEVIYYANVIDIMGLHGEMHSHVACYDFSTGEPIEIWYHPFSGVTLDYVYHPEHIIAGMRGNDKVIALDYTSGILIDSVQLDRSLENPQFFETENGLSLAGRVHDTVFVYTFDTPTDVADSPNGALPDNPFDLRCHPNPFNAQTIIEFDLPRTQRVHLSVYNVLGQEVATLIDEIRSVGPHSITWDGTDVSGHSIASGVYFYRLQGGSLTAVQKMIIVK